MRNRAVLLSICAWCALAGAARADDGDVVLPQQVQQAKICAAEAAAVKDAYAALRDHLRSRGAAARAEVLLDEAEAALAKARTACGADQDVSRSFDELATESEMVRRALAPPPR